MKILAFLLLIATLPVQARAQTPSWVAGKVLPEYYDNLDRIDYLWVKEVTNLQLKFIGSGAKSRKTQESVALVCVGIPRVAGGTPDCDYARFVYWNPQTRRAFAFADTYHLYHRETHDETVLTREYITRYWQNFMDGMTQMDDSGHKYRNRSMLPAKKASGAITYQKDWNWASNPSGMSDSKWLRLVNALNGGHVLAPAFALQYTLSDQSPTSMRKYPLNPYMIRLQPNQKNRWLH